MASPPQKKKFFSSSSTSAEYSPTREYSGYITAVSEEKISSTSGSTFFNVNLKISPGNKDAPRKIFLDRKTSGEPVTLTKIAAGREGIHFFNSFRGSQIAECSALYFGIDDNESIKIKEIKQKTTGLYIVSGQLKWLGEQHEILDAGSSDGKTTL